MINFDDFKKVDIRIGKILSAEKVTDSEKLLKLSVDVGEETPRQVISGIAAYFPEPSILLGRNFTFATNIEPRTILGFESQAMILAANGDDFALLEVPGNISPGTAIK